jgi:hypothetical protein
MKRLIILAPTLSALAIPTSSIAFIGSTQAAVNCSHTDMMVHNLKASGTSCFVARALSKSESDSPFGFRSHIREGGRMWKVSYREHGQPGKTWDSETARSGSAWITYEVRP